MKQTKYNTKMHLSQLTQVAATAECGTGQREGRCKCSKYVLIYVT